MKAKELRKDNAALQQELLELTRERFNLRMQHYWSIDTPTSLA